MSPLLHNIFQKTSEFFLDLLFPRMCVSCKKEGTYLCSSCEILIFPKPTFHSYDGLQVFSCFDYEERKPLAKLIHVWKYGFATDVESCMDSLLARALSHSPQNTAAFFQNALLCPVPLHKKRFSWRGFNQSEHLAFLMTRNIARLWKFEIPVRSLLIRKIDTKPQVELPREKRLTNVKDAFEISPRSPENWQKKIILVDDIVTTGTTINECAKVLKKYFPKAEILAAVLATPPAP